MTQFKPKIEDPDPKATFEVMLTRKMTYDQVRRALSILPVRSRVTINACFLPSPHPKMANKVSEALGGHDPIKLRFTSASGNSNAPKGIIKRSLNQSVTEILHSSYGNPVAMLYYEKLDVSIVELETKKSLKVTWTGSQNKDEGQHSFLLPKTNTISDLEQHLAKLVTFAPGGTGKVRFFEITNVGRRKGNDFSGSEMIGNINELTELFAEVRGVLSLLTS